MNVREEEQKVNKEKFFVKAWSLMVISWYAYLDNYKATTHIRTWLDSWSKRFKHCYIFLVAVSLTFKHRQL